jgi:hypothetical protein
MYPDEPQIISAMKSGHTASPTSMRRQKSTIVKDIGEMRGIALVDENAVMLHEPNILKVDIGGDIHIRAREKIEQSPLYPVFVGKLKEYIRDPRSEDPDLRFVDYRVLAVLSDNRAIARAVEGAAVEFGKPQVKSITRISYLGSGCFNTAFQIDVRFVDGTTGTFVLRGPSDPRADYAAYAIMKAGGTKVPASSKAYEATDTEGRKIQMSIQEFAEGGNIGTKLDRISRIKDEGLREQQAEKVIGSYFENMATSLFYGLLDNHEGNFLVQPDSSIIRLDYGVHANQHTSALTINNMAARFMNKTMPLHSDDKILFNPRMQTVAKEAFTRKWNELQQKRGEVKQKMQELADAGQLVRGNGANHGAIDYNASGEIKSENGLDILGNDAIQGFESFSSRTAEDVYAGFENAYVNEVKESIMAGQQQQPSKPKSQPKSPPQPQQAVPSKETPHERPKKD